MAKAKVKERCPFCWGKFDPGERGYQTATDMYTTKVHRRCLRAEKLLISEAIYEEYGKDELRRLYHKRFAERKKA